MAWGVPDPTAPRADGPAADEDGGRCLAEPSALLSVIGAVTLGREVFSADLDSGALGQRLEQNVATMQIEAPLLLGQGEADSLVAPTVQDAYVRSRCEAGQAIDYRSGTSWTRIRKPLFRHSSI